MVIFKSAISPSHVVENVSNFVCILCIHISSVCALQNTRNGCFTNFPVLWSFYCPKPTVLLPCLRTTKDNKRYTDNIILYDRINHIHSSKSTESDTSMSPVLLEELQEKNSPIRYRDYLSLIVLDNDQRMI